MTKAKVFSGQNVHRLLTKIPIAFTLLAQLFSSETFKKLELSSEM
jgi:hypothetical protein